MPGNLREQDGSQALLSLTGLQQPAQQGLLCHFRHVVSYSMRKSGTEPSSVSEHVAKASSEAATASLAAMPVSSHTRSPTVQSRADVVFCLRLSTDKASITGARARLAHASPSGRHAKLRLSDEPSDSKRSPHLLPLVLVLSCDVSQQARFEASIPLAGRALAGQCMARLRSLLLMLLQRRLLLLMRPSRCTRTQGCGTTRTGSHPLTACLQRSHCQTVNPHFPGEPDHGNLPICVLGECLS